MALYVVAVGSLGAYVAVFLALLGIGWLVYHWRSGGRYVYLVLSAADLLLIFPFIAWASRSSESGFPALSTALYGYGVASAWALLTRKQLPDWILPLRGTWARMAIATSALIALTWELIRGALDLSSRFNALGFVAVLFFALIAYWYPLWWALVHGWKLPKKWETDCSDVPSEGTGGTPG